MKTQFELEEMTKAQIVSYGLENGKEIDPLMKKGDMIELALEGAEIVENAPVKVIEDPEKPLPRQDTLRELDTGKKVKDEMFKVTIHATESRTSDVDVTINGHRYHIKRDVEVTVPAAVVEVLKNAVVETYKQDPETGHKTKFKVTHYPFSAVPA